MTKIAAPSITAYSKEDFTRISFKPDYAKFGMTEGLDKDTEALFRRRVFDLAGCVKDVKVFLNGERIKIRSFRQYVDLYLNQNAASNRSKPTDENCPVPLAPSPPVVHEVVNDRWEVCCTASDGQFQQVSFVNAICTSKGGTHVNMIADQITSALIEVLRKKKEFAEIKPHQVKSHLSIFINCLVENPAFDSQTKENLTLRASSFGGKPCQLSDEFIKKVLKSGIMETVTSWARGKQDQQLKKTDGTKRTRLSGIAKLDDANHAGGRGASQCTLILTEGDSAKALAVSGLGVVGRDKWGVFPLRGKLLNVREANAKQIAENAEVTAIKQILGLQQGKVYDSTSSLRYGRLMLMTDQDHDGSHIKGLLINLFDHFWPSLLKIPDFLVEFITPIVRVSKGSGPNRAEISFFTIPEYEQWKRSQPDNASGWTIKYYKGLGTSTSADAKAYFSNMQRHLKSFSPISTDERGLVDMAFNKKRADERKEWLKTCTSETFMDHSAEVLKIGDFINHELILFSMADNQRSIPSMADGLKPGQRKILFSCFKRKLKGEIKVMQLAGYVSEHAAYHHGEQSLCSTIVGMAQDFCGSNNLNLLLPNGQFGTRLQGGKDAASPRYIFTGLGSLTRLLYRPEDDALLKYLSDDGQSIEPEWYLPILPMVLVNGGEGIGTGWSTSIPNYNPSDIIANVRRLMVGQDTVTMHPWYTGFRGTIEAESGGKYRVSGRYSVDVAQLTVEITELPIGTWTQNYKEFLEGLLVDSNNSGILKDYREHHTDRNVHFSLTFSSAEALQAVMSEGIERRLKLVGSLSTSNIVCFDVQGRLKRFPTAESILLDWYETRLSFYQKRKAWMADVLTREWTRLDARMRFVREIVDGVLVIRGRKKAEIVKDLSTRGYPLLESANTATAESNAEVEVTEEGENNKEVSGTAKGYDYLLSMPIYSLTKEKIDQLARERDNKEAELNNLLARTPKDLWSADLDEFEAAWEKNIRQIDNLVDRHGNGGNVIGSGKSGNTSAGAKRKPAVKKVSSMESITSIDEEYSQGKESVIASQKQPLNSKDTQDLPAKILASGKGSNSASQKQASKSKKSDDASSVRLQSRIDQFTGTKPVNNTNISSAIASYTAAKANASVPKTDERNNVPVFDGEDVFDLPLAERISRMLGGTAATKKPDTIQGTDLQSNTSKVDESEPPILKKTKAPAVPRKKKVQVVSSEKEDTKKNDFLQEKNLQSNTNTREESEPSILKKTKAPAVPRKKKVQVVSSEEEDTKKPDFLQEKDLQSNTTTLEVSEPSILKRTNAPAVPRKKKVQVVSSDEEDLDVEIPVVKTRVARKASTNKKFKAVIESSSGESAAEEEESAYEEVSD